MSKLVVKVTGIRESRAAFGQLPTWRVGYRYYTPEFGEGRIEYAANVDKDNAADELAAYLHFTNSMQERGYEVVTDDESKD